MTPVNFSGANKMFKAPPDFEESQVKTIPAFIGSVKGGSCDGQHVTVVCWQPTAEEIAAMLQGEPIFLTWFGLGLVPHMLTTNFHDATHPA